MASAQSFDVSARGRRLGVADAMLAAIVVAVVGLMVVPLPTWLLDFLLATNLAMSVVILLVALYVSDGLKIAAFPSILLLTTLIRLALNVSSTRLILLQADAGEVIRAFGQFVVRGNYVVGGVVFLVLTIIQFVVIAKGAERVAEVGARFTLDALPGKQMAIDAELRSGSIDTAEARSRRRALARESQFYGAMDGAMKFVKGDVIASLLIAVINILGGLAIGVMQRGMSAEVALKRYGLLTIGDGLVTQIPSLVLATAAGILVTRVASEAPDQPLGAELASQILGQPRALFVSAGFVLLLAAVPGLPALPFLAIAALLFVAARGSERAQKRAQRERQHLLRAGDKGHTRFVPGVVPWSLELSSDLYVLEDDERRAGQTRQGIRSALREGRSRLFLRFGVPLPEPVLSLDAELSPRTAVLAIHEIPARTLSVPSSLPPERLPEFLGQAVMDALAPRLSGFLGIAETQALLDEIEAAAPALVRQVVPKPVSLPVLAEVLRRLVDERVSVRDLRSVLEALAGAGGLEKDALSLAEFVRSQLRRSITFSLVGAGRELAVFVLDSPLEETIRAAIQRTPAGSYLALAPAAARDIVHAVQRATASWPAPGRPVLLAQPDIRRFVRKLLETELPELDVVSPVELMPELAVRAVTRASLS